VNIAALDIATKNDLANQFITDGLLVLPRVGLPPAFVPPVTDLVFLRLDDATCEVHIGSDTSYVGASPAWQEINARSEGPGRTRFVLSVRGDLFVALKAFEGLVRESAMHDDGAGLAVDGSLARGGTPGSGAAGLTDMEAVHEGIRDIYRPMYLDEDELFEQLCARIRGQDDALRALSAAVVRHCARPSPARPAVVFSIGPSGVGKTRTAEVLAEVLADFDDDKKSYQYLRLDMTEYQEPHRVSQLLGAPQGYVGHGEGSQLVDALRTSGGRLIVLFDEIDKAHPRILRVLMNAMDAGRLSTPEGSAGDRELDCRRSVFIFTSNLDAKAILTELETRQAFGNRPVEDDVCRRRLHATGIAPEIVGRIGRFLVYRPLSAETRAEIMALAIVDVAKEYDVEVAYIDPKVIIHLMQEVRSQSFGVRPERFLIDDLLGGVFSKVAKQGVAGPVQVTGPPFHCGPVEPATKESRPVDEGLPAPETPEETEP